MSLPEPTRDDNAGPASSGRIAEQLRGFGPIGLLALVVILAGNLVLAPMSALFVLIWARLSHTPWQALGFGRPRSWTRTLMIGIPFGIAFKLGMKAIVMPLFAAPALNPPYQYLAGNAAALPWALYTMIVVGGFGEETLFRGFLFERLGKVLGVGRGALALTVVLTSGLFAAVHYREQGLAGVQQAAVTGLVFGTIYAVGGRLWFPMVAHAAFDLTAVGLIFWRWETAVAHLLFR